MLSCTSEATKEEKLATHYCGSCHMTPEPQHLTSEIWEENIFPAMSDYFKWNERSTYQYSNKSFYYKKGNTPMTDELWTTLLDYYKSNAPNEILERERISLDPQDFFDVTVYDKICNSPNSSAITIGSKGEVWISCDESIKSLKLDGMILDSIVSPGDVSQIIQDSSDNLWVLSAGILDPHDNSLGSLRLYDSDLSAHRVVYDALQRPVFALQNKNSWIISEFGNNTGQLMQYARETNDKTKLLGLPGSYKTFGLDIDNDGTQEWITIVSQAQEGIYKISQETAEIRRMISFPPEFGSSDLDTADVNLDGYVDLIVANGDNADFSNILKAYHGIRVFLNNKHGGFEEAFFYPMYGVSQVRAININEDRKVDLIVSSFFSSPNESSIVVLKNTSSDDTVTFDPSEITQSSLGNWMVMTKGDIDLDGDQDIALVSYHINPKLDTKDEAADLLVLKNKLVQ